MSTSKAKADEYITFAGKLANMWITFSAKVVKEEESFQGVVGGRVPSWGKVETGWQAENKWSYFRGDEGTKSWAKK